MIIDKNVDRLRQLDLIFDNRINTMFSNAHTASKRPFWMQTSWWAAS